MTANSTPSPSERITQHINELGGWRGSMLARLRKRIHASDPGLTEEWKWGSPVWAKNGLVVSLGAFKEHVKITFFKGAGLEDPDGLFNAGHDAKTMRSIDLREGDEVDESALTALVRAAVALNTGNKKK